MAHVYNLWLKKNNELYPYIEMDIDNFASKNILPRLHRGFIKCSKKNKDNLIKVLDEHSYHYNFKQKKISSNEVLISCITNTSLSFCD